jgi:two-component sensor histidine kinase
MSFSRKLGEAPRWLWIVALFTGAGVFDATQNVLVMRSEGMHHNWTQLFVTLLLTWLPWALATPLVLRLGRQFPPERWRNFSTSAAHLGMCAAIGLTTSAWSAVLDELLNPWAATGGPGPFRTLWLHKFENGLLADIILYGMILLVGRMMESREQLARQATETARLNEQLSKAQLSALRRQIEPHFLFNTLNAIAGLVRENRNDAAVRMIARLSDLLRRALDNSNRHQVPLEEELEFALEYLEIQKTRFAERLQVRVEVPSELFSAQVPGLILQPMVENAIKHGIARRVQGGTVRIASSRDNGYLRLSVYNDGPALPARFDGTQTGIGLSNVRTRLEGLYGEKFELSIHNREPGGVEVSMCVPYATSAQE